MDKLFKSSIAELDTSPLPDDIVIFWRAMPYPEKMKSCPGGKMQSENHCYRRVADVTAIISQL